MSTVKNEKTGDPVRESKKQTPVGLIALAIVLAGILVFVVVAYQKQKKSMYEMEKLLTSEKDSLENELRLIMHGYDTLRSNNDTLNAQLGREQDRIRQLLSINASNVQLIKTYKAEIGTLRSIMQNYIVQIDSLNTRNKLLTAENIEIRGQIDRVSQDNLELKKTTESLSEKVEIASVILAKNIAAEGLNTKAKVTDRLERLNKLRVCFTLRENRIAEAGRKTVYLRIIRPDGLVITESPDNIFTIDGEAMVYSARRDVDYENMDIEMCIYVDNTGDFLGGESTAELYMEGSLIGSTRFSLRSR